MRYINISLYKSFSEEALGHTLMSARNFFLKPEESKDEKCAFKRLKRELPPFETGFMSCSSLLWSTS
jgi:hypothetical protein